MGKMKASCPNRLLQIGDKGSWTEKGSISLERLIQLAGKHCHGLSRPEGETCTFGTRWQIGGRVFSQRAKDNGSERRRYRCPGCAKLARLI